MDRDFYLIVVFSCSQFITLVDLFSSESLADTRGAWQNEPDFCNLLSLPVNG